LDKILSYSFDRHWWPKQSPIFKRLLYLICLISSLYYLWDLSALFGPDSYIIRQPKIFSGLHDLAFVLYSHPNLALYFLLSAGGLSVAGLSGYRSLLTDLVLWLLFVNLHYAIYPGITGGHYLLNQLLFFQVLIFYPRKAAAIPVLAKHQLRNFLSNCGVVFIMMQVCVIYLVSAFAKLGDASWLSGEAVGQVAALWHFRLDDQLVLNQPFLQKTLNYLVLVYQLVFPVLIWLRPFKKTLLLLGFCIYLYIALYMGLMSFGLTMMAAHLYFWPLKTAES